MKNRAIAIGFLCVSTTSAIGGEYFQSYVSLVKTASVEKVTAPALIDTNNVAAKVSSTALDLRTLLQTCEIGGVKPGMTMDDVVTRWGKPKASWSRCVHGLPSLFYSDASLGFEGNAVETVRVVRQFALKAKAPEESDLEGFLRLLGPPAEKCEDIKNERQNLVYTSTNGCVRFDFSERNFVGITLERNMRRAAPWKK